MLTLQVRYRIRRCGKFYLCGLVGFGALFVVVDLVSKLRPPVEDIQVFGGAYDDKTFITGSRANRRRQIVRDFLCVIPDKSDSFTRIVAKKARYVAPSHDRLSGGWLLIGTCPLEIDKSPLPASLEMIVPGRFFLRTKDVDFATLARR